MSSLQHLCKTPTKCKTLLSCYALLNLTLHSILVYPQSGTGAVNINRAELARLEPGEFLNDTLIELGLKCVGLVQIAICVTLLTICP